MILAELIKNWIKKNIDWDTFKRLAYSVERAHPSVFPIVYAYYKNYEIVSRTSAGTYAQYNPLIIGSGFGSYFGNPTHLGISRDALDVCEYGMKKLLDDQYEILPRDVIDRLQSIKRKGEKLLNDPIFSGYEQWLVELGVPTSISNFKIRKEIFDKIRKHYSV